MPIAQSPSAQSPSAQSPNRSNSWWRSAPVLVIAVLALIMSTAGGAYAVAKNSVGNKQLKKNAVTSSKIKSSTIQSSDVKNGSLTTKDFAAGQLAPLPAGSSKIYFARIDSSGVAQAKSKGITATSRVGVGTYLVTHSFDATKCATQATATVSYINVGGEGGSSSTYFYTRDITLEDNPYYDSGFSITFVC